MQSTSASTVMQVADTLSFSSSNYHWNSINLRKIVCVMTSCPTSLIGTITYDRAILQKVHVKKYLK